MILQACDEFVHDLRFEISVGGRKVADVFYCATLIIQALAGIS